MIFTKLFAGKIVQSVIGMGSKVPITGGAKTMQKSLGLSFSGVMETVNNSNLNLMSENSTPSKEEDRKEPIAILAIAALAVITKGAIIPKLSSVFTGAVTKAGAAAVTGVVKIASKKTKVAAKAKGGKKASSINAAKRLIKGKLAQEGAVSRGQDEQSVSVALNSSVLTTAVYNKENEMLKIRFMSGSEYMYADVPEHIFSMLATASSHGSYFYWNVRGAGVPYPYAPPFAYIRIQ